MDVQLLKLLKKSQKQVIALKQQFKKLLRIKMILKKLKMLLRKKKKSLLQKKEKAVIKKQKENAIIKIQGKTLDQLTQDFGKSDFIREYGNTKTVRFNSSSCRLFIYFNLEAKKLKAEYYEIRNTKGEPIDKKEKINKCFKEIQKT